MHFLEDHNTKQGKKNAEGITLKGEKSTSTKSSFEITHLAMHIFAHPAVIFNCFKALVFLSQ